MTHVTVVVNCPQDQQVRVIHKQFGEENTSILENGAEHNFVISGDAGIAVTLEPHGTPQ